MQKQTSKWFFNIKVNFIAIMLFILINKSEPAIAIENDSSQPFKKENLRESIKLDLEAVLKQSKIEPTKKYYVKAKIFLSETGLENIRIFIPETSLKINKIYKHASEYEYVIDKDQL
jgi:predicted component of type VI protein secretion system